MSEDLPPVIYQGTVPYYREGVLYGRLLPEGKLVETNLTPELWGRIVLKYKTKEKDVEAIQVQRDNLFELMDWSGGMLDPYQPTSIMVPNVLHGNVLAIIGDYIVKDEHGRYHVYPEEIFKDNFKLV